MTISRRAVAEFTKMDAHHRLAAAFQVNSLRHGPQRRWRKRLRRPYGAHPPGGLGLDITFILALIFLNMPRTEAA